MTEPTRSRKTRRPKPAADGDSPARAARTAPASGQDGQWYLCVHTRYATPLPPRNGLRRWKFGDTILVEIPLDSLYWTPDSAEFERTASLMSQRPHRHRGD